MGKQYDLTEEAGESILPLIDRAERELTVYSPFISPVYAEKLVGVAERGVDVSVYTAPGNGNDFQDESLQILHGNSGLSPTGVLPNREGVGVLLLSTAVLLAMVACSVCVPLAVLSLLSLGGAVYFLRGEGDSNEKSGPVGGLSLHLISSLHAKVYSRDGGEEVIVGSANLTVSGMAHNLEVISEVGR